MSDPRRLRTWWDGPGVGCRDLALMKAVQFEGMFLTTQQTGWYGIAITTPGHENKSHPKLTKTYAPPLPPRLIIPAALMKSCDANFRARKMTGRLVTSLALECIWRMNIRLDTSGRIWTLLMANDLTIVTRDNGSFCPAVRLFTPFLCVWSGEKKGKYTGRYVKQNELVGMKWDKI
ncbi:hypothetical protein CEXT_500911 [Caerostris extrusa]|uniref:Uncharacterized protein n=1 Tax=Caerostris extrusa TaxID=172846 RepID=A0AAV4X8M6_CAEEX|nr:hypothetical protein CEXT_500911 [Caerostris extrusa]